MHRQATILKNLGVGIAELASSRWEVLVRGVPDKFRDVTTVDEAKNVLTEEGIKVVEETRIDHGVRLRGDGGQIVNVFGTGKVSVQGKNIAGLKERFDNVPSTGSKTFGPGTPSPTEVFVVYGHNEEAKNETELMLRKWGLEPILLDQVPVEGLTLIQKLEKYIQTSPFAVVLATADDVCLSDPDDDDQREFRARQNVVLELGMLLAHLGRPNVAILLEDREDMKKPSDIDGLEYLPFTRSVAEIRLGLAKMMRQRGYAVDIDSL